MHLLINIRENHRGNQDGTIQKCLQNWEHKKQDEVKQNQKQKTKTDDHCVMANSHDNRPISLVS